MEEIFGIKWGKAEKFSDHFKAVYVDTDMGYWESKETFHHEEEGLTFDYKYVVDFGVLENHGETTCYYALYLMPLKEFWDKKVLAGVMESFCVDCESVNAMDAVMEGGIAAHLGCTYEDEMEAGACGPNEEVLDAIASVYLAVDGLRGFFLDRPWNRIGTTGWDCLHHALHGTPLF